MLDVSCCAGSRQVLLLLVVTLVLWLPGTALGAVAGLRGLLLLGTAPVLTFALVAVLLLPATAGVPWTPATAAAGAVGCIAAVAGGRRWLVSRAARDDGDAPPAFVADGSGEGRGRPLTWHGAALVAAGVAVAAAVAVTTFSLAVEQLGDVPQSFDAPFHLSAVRLIAEEQDAASSTLAAIQHYEEPGRFVFYPYGWHALAALVYAAGGWTVPEVVAALVLVTAAAVLPLGVASLARIGGCGAAGTAAASAVSTWFTSFPYDLWRWGQLFAYFSGLALLAGFVALLVASTPSRRWTALLPGVAAAGLLAVHPGVGMAGAVVAALLTAQRAVTAPRGSRRGVVVHAALIAAVALAASLVPVTGMARAAGRVAAWESPVGPSTVDTAVREVLLFTHDQPSSQLLLAVLAAAGLVVVASVRHQWCWWALGGLFFAVSFVVAASPLVEQPWARVVSGPWYNDRWRILAQVPVFAAVLIGVGADALDDGVRRVSDGLAAARRSPRRPGVVLGPATVVVLLLVAYARSDAGYVERNADRFDFAWSPGPLVSDLELEGMRRLAELVQPGERVMNDPRDGSAYLYPLTGVRTVFGHIDDVHGDGQTVLGKRFSELDDDERVQEAIRDLDVTYVMTSRGALEVGDDVFDFGEGLEDLDEADALELVYENPDTRIYRVALPDDDDG